jgi:hypothetical protein
MNPALWAVLGGAAALTLALLCAVLLLLLTQRRRQHHDAAALGAARADVEALRAQVDTLTHELEQTRQTTAATPAVPSEFVITTAGTGDVTTSEAPDRPVLSMTVGEPLVRLAALGYGVRRALSAQSRNRIRFEMRREVRRARKERRRAARRSRPTSPGREEAA